MKKYDHKILEKKWQKEWEKAGLYKTDESREKPKCYVLDMFPYPSGEGLHVGHPKGYIATDVYSRFKKMNGFNVLHPMGWDAFGLPAEQYAIKNKIHPRVAVEKNVARFKEQLSVIGFNYDWERELSTTDPKFYKWTQWIFLKLVEKGLAYESYEPINWCPSCQTGLANEDLDGDACERCGTVVEKKPMRQWVLRITDYAERLLADIDALEWPESIKESQKNWIGKSEGAVISFQLLGFSFRLDVFTTRPDTLFGATYIVLSPEHELVEKLKEKISNWSEVEKYREEVKNKTEIERTSLGREKTGVRLEGIMAINPANNEEIPVFTADYVLAHYGTGAIMAVPAHDERDYKFAKKYNLPVRQVVMPCAPDPANPPQDGFKEVERETVIVFLKNKKDNTYALLDWHGTLEGITTGIMGGVEAGQTPEEAILAEIAEEAAIPNAKITKKLRWTTGARYCASHKKENRRAIAHAFFAEVDDLSKQGNIDADEAEKHTLVWEKEEKILSRLTPIHQKLLWGQLHEETALSDSGILMNSGEFTGMNSEEAKKAITEFIGGKMKTTYKLRDWVFSRQRYWGEPIPIIHCEKCGVVPVPEKDLPIKLPEVEFYEPTGTGESPLAAISSWVNVKCPKCGGEGKRETNTMPQWAGSSWYYVRFIDPKNSEALVDKEKEKYWSPVDMYVGGAEHATRHLIYARFWHKFLYDIGAVNYAEPFKKLHNVGLILAQDGRKMSKRWGNVVNPDDIVEEYGADTLRIYEMFMGPFEQSVAWSTEGVIGPRRFLEKVWKMHERIKIEDLGFKSTTIETLLHQTIKKVSEDIEAFKFNTAISALMILVNAFDKEEEIPLIPYSLFLILLSPFAPHIAEELWHELGHESFIYSEKWPKFDEEKIQNETMTIAVQVNGKVRATFEAETGDFEENITQKALSLPELEKWLEGKKPKKIIYVKGKLVSIVV